MSENRHRLRWPHVGLMALALAFVTASVIWTPVLIHELATDREAQRAQSETVNASLQAYVESAGPSIHSKTLADIASLLPYDSISLERTPCYGACPIYTVTFFKDGRATLVELETASPRRRYFEGNIGAEDFIRLTQLVGVARSAARETDYRGGWTDDYTAIIRATSAEDPWQVSDYGRVAPVEVWILETFLHNLKEQTDWSEVAAPGASR